MDEVKTPTAADKNCMPCRLTGMTVLIGTGVYALAAARPGKPGSPLERRIMGVVGAAFVVAGIGRAIYDDGEISLLVNRNTTSN
ncbi:hypothetical protein FRB94_007049 [Tulasnella sp. JGI-2019a]|nr:hypothetical protein FRB94_007049 [Tulasnella sp. JGI-2019a]KAG9016961.1 hypothetical protein FRB93_009491 [Tulasnella sp. JGI-2019a]KAG9040143.1 hypothetical protein FRB95_000072 [Tulasnella sp. JGI-2019a]